MTPRKKMTRSAWSETAGMLPTMITVEERLARKGAIYLRHWDSAAGNWRWKSLVRGLQHAGLGATSLRDANGQIIQAVAAWAVEQAWGWYRVLSGLSPSDSVPGVPSAAPLTIGGTWSVITAKDTGLYPVVTDHAKEVKRALDFAGVVWGADTAWAVLGRADLTKLMRRRLEGLLRSGRVGMRSTEITVTRILAVAQWLRDQMHIPSTALPHSSRWRDDLRKDWLSLSGAKKLPEPNQPRYTVKESRAIRVAAWEVDPRAGLLLSLAAEYRGGQARRATRTDLVLTPTDSAPHGTFTIHGRGKKKGEVVYLTAGQRADVDRALVGYLAPLETQFAAGDLGDYPLFPSGRMRGRKAGEATITEKMHVTEPVHRDWSAKTFRQIEQRAKVDHVQGRLLYGHRRINVDFVLAEHVSDEALKASGGWKSTDVPRDIYADKANSTGRSEAAAARAKLRGESDGDMPKTITGEAE